FAMVAWSPPCRGIPLRARRQVRTGLQFGGGLLPGGMPLRAWLALLVALLGSRAALAVQLEALEAGREWRLRAPGFRGNPARGQVFGEDAYERAVAYLRAYYRERSFARVRVRKRAQVDVRHDRARVAYEVASGPPSVFGEVRVTGTRAVDPEVVHRELAFRPG